MDQENTPLSQWPLADWTRAVAHALQQCGSYPALARSPLAQTALTEPALVLDDVAPTADERGRALRLVLQWAVQALAPATASAPFGDDRSLDDPTWRDPRWWRYNILRHRYLEPLHPDLFVSGGRIVETLLSLTGISDSATFYDVRNRALRDVAYQLQEQAAHGAASAAIRSAALADALSRLDGHPAAQTLLEMAATFFDLFPDAWLMSLVSAERLPNAADALRILQRERLLRTSADGTLHWLSPAVRAHVVAQTLPARLRRRHATVAQLSDEAGEPLRAARHWLAAGKADEAADGLLRHAPALRRDLAQATLLEVLGHFRPNQITPDRWLALQLQAADAQREIGDLKTARATCRRALAAASTPVARGQLYRRLGKLYEGHNALQALGYYQQALDALPSAHPERIDCLKDRGWLLILRRDWDAAADDLQQALALAADAAQRADVLDAQAVLLTRQGQAEQGVEIGRKALALRELAGDRRRVARSLHNLALAYDALGRYDDAIAAYGEALAFYQALDDATTLATITLSLGVSYHFSGRLAQAVAHYRACLGHCARVETPLVQVKAHGNLAEALAELGESAEAQQQWQQGHALAQRHGFDDQVGYFNQLTGQFPALARSEPPPLAEPAPSTVGDVVAEQALALAASAGSVTARDLMTVASVSKATATRRLSQLTAQGQLVRRGQRRGVHYVLPDGGVGDGEVVSAELSQQLQAAWPHLSTRYAVSDIAVLRSQPLRLAVKFAAPPTLDAFFELETELAQLLGQPVDLLPHRTASVRGAPLRWLGRP